MLRVTPRHLSIMHLLGVSLCLVYCRPAEAQTPTSSPATTQAGETDLARYVPAEALTVYWGRPTPEIRAGDHVLMRLLKWVELARELNLIPSQYRTITDLAGCLPAIGRHDHVVMLLDVSSRPVGTAGYRLAQMQLATVVATHGQDQEIKDRIRLLLTTYTDKHFARLEVISRGETKSYRLTDSRLPGWATWEWGQVGPCYVVGLGAGAFDRIVEAYARANRSIAGDAWFDRARNRCQGNGAMIAWYVNYQGIRRELEPVVKDRTEQVLEALGAGKLQRGLCTFRLEGRYMVSYVMHQTEAGDTFTELSDPRTLSPQLLRPVPPEASCAVFDIELATWVKRLATAYAASWSPDEQKQWSEWFTRFERQRGVDAQTQLLDRLGKRLVVHTWPPHPLKLPLTFTLLIEIDDPAPVRDFVDAILGAWFDLQRHPATTTAPTTTPTTHRTRDQFRWRLGREPDGMWYLHAGLVRPAIAVSDRYIVISWSPEAVRANLEFLGRIEPPPTSAPTTNR